MKRLLIIARDYNSAQHYAKERKLSPGRWVYISSYHNIMGNPGCDYIKIPGWESRPDIDMLETALTKNNCLGVKYPLEA